jgi:hypothetical protein
MTSTKGSKQGRRATRAESDNSSFPKTTRPLASSRRRPDGAEPDMVKGRRILDAVPDRIDIRDWFYRPSLAQLPDQIVSIDRVPLILDQGTEGACTGFALAAVINFLAANRTGANLKKNVSASPRMLYEMARRYDEWPGEDYDGSSARGAMIGWTRHGVCLRDTWPDHQKGPEHLTPDVAGEARRLPGGAFYRVSHREIRDMHAALAEVGILYMTLMVHDGWFEPSSKMRPIDLPGTGKKQQIKLPVIQRSGRADSGHAVAIVGYTAEGFIIQNSWGADWGERGFALLPYEDYMLHATDVWVAQVGVPVTINLWEGGNADTTAGVQRASPAVPLADIRPFVVDLGNNGELSRSGNYWTTEEDLRRLFMEIIPEATKSWKKRRVMLYLHGGLNDEVAVARRIIAFRDVLRDNEVYPLHIMWESGVMESVRQMVEDLFTDVDHRAGGVADWLRRTRDGLLDAKDWSLELTVSKPGSALWNEMKENARLSSEHPDQKGGAQLITKYIKMAMNGASAAAKSKWELHIVGHSAGCIYMSYAMPHLLGLGIELKSIQFMAPAMTTRLFKERLLTLIKEKKCPLPRVYILSDVGERDDDVGPYGKSLLYLVSNAFEERRGTPLLGMERNFRKLEGERDSEHDPELAKLFADALVVAGESQRPDGALSRSDSHGGFDNDPDTMNSVLRGIVGADLKREFHLRDLQF